MKPLPAAFARKYPIANAAPVRSELGHLLAKYAITLTDGFLTSSRILRGDESPKENEIIWYAYVEPNADSEYMGDETYTDLLNPKMTERFIQLTHEVYKNHVGGEFGDTIPSIFTDEPQYSPMSTLNSSDGEGEVFMPWTLGLVESFRETYGHDLVDLLPKIIWDEKSGERGLQRTRFLNHVCDLFTDNYIGVLSSWCRKNNLICTGHMNSVSTMMSDIPSVISAREILTGSEPRNPHFPLRRHKQVKS